MLYLMQEGMSALAYSDEVGEVTRSSRNELLDTRKKERSGVLQFLMLVNNWCTFGVSLFLVRFNF